jgi:bifunctional non-homologous end joining protein LigD
VTSASLAKRPGRLFLDYLRNGRGTTAVGAYSPRVRAGFPVAMPVTWREVEKGIFPDAFTLESPPKLAGSEPAPSRSARSLRRRECHAR